MDYGIELGGILGMDFLRAAGAIIDLARGEIHFGQEHTPASSSES
jgi:hypothetical protein